MMANSLKSCWNGGLQVKIEGNIEDQFSQWQMVLGDIYESESSQTKQFEIL